LRYISKTTPPEFFAESVRNYDSDTKWKALRNQKPRLKCHILENEQKYLCAYCEISLDNDRLNKYRLDARKALEKEAGKLLKLQGTEFTRQKIKSVLSSDDSVPKLEPFITFLQFCFKAILK